MLTLESHRDLAVDWILNAQNVGPDSGVSAYYHIDSGYCQTSYPEVTGYIVPTMFDTAILTGEQRYRDAAIEMIDWVTSVQLDTGAATSMDFSTPYVFDTGQDILGWVRVYEETHNAIYLDAAINAGDWLSSIQQPDGWFPTTAYSKSTHTYHSRVAWALLRLSEVSQRSIYRDMAILNLNWVVSKQQDNGWFDISANDEITHLIAYTGRGLLEASVLLGTDDYLQSARRLADVLLEIQLDSGRLYGRYDFRWHPTVEWHCVTGDLQIAIIWLRLYHMTGNEDYHRGAKSAIVHVTKIQNIESSEKGIRGGIPGSDPLGGDYCPRQYLSWGTKFYIDAVHLMLDYCFVLMG